MNYKKPLKKSGTFQSLRNSCCLFTERLSGKGGGGESGTTPPFLNTLQLWSQVLFSFQVSSFRPDMLRDCGFNFFEQQKNFNGRLKPMAPNQSFMSPVRPIIHSDTSLAQNQGMNLGSPEDVGFGLSQKDRNTVFINRMRELAINAQQGLPSSSFDIETSNLSLPKPQPIPPQPNSPPVSPRSPKPIG